MIEKHTLLGLKKSGMSVQIDILTNDSEQSEYDYFCDVSLVENTNGNGYYTASFFDKSYAQGFPLGKWILLKGSIGFSWGNSSASFILMDENGNETPWIKTTSSQRGAAGGFELDLHIRSIFITAQQIIGEYPSVIIYNAISKLRQSKPNSYTLSKFKTIEDNEGFIDSFICETLDKLNSYFKIYEETKKILQNSDDTRAKRLLQVINKETKELVNSIM